MRKGSGECMNTQRERMNAQREREMNECAERDGNE